MAVDRAASHRSQLLSIGAVRDLSQHPQWVCWRAETVGDKVKKVPICPGTGHHASVTNPSHWASFAEAAEYAETHDDISGIGFVLVADGEYRCIDLDGCRDPETGAINQHALNLILAFDTFTEISPSGTGIHLWCRGDLPGDRCRKPGIEIYSRDRYITITGDRLDPELIETDEIEERSRQLAALYQETFGAPCAPRNSDNGNGERGAGGDGDAYDRPCSRYWRFEDALPHVERALKERAAIGRLLAPLRKNGRRFRELMDRSKESDRGKLKDDDSAWDLAIADRLLKPELDPDGDDRGLDWPDLVGLLVHCRSQWSTEKLDRADYWARTIARASDQYARRAEHAAERAVERAEREAEADDIEHLRSLNHTAAGFNGEAVALPFASDILAEVRAKVGCPPIIKITRANVRGEPLFSIHFGKNETDVIEGDHNLLSSQAKFRGAIAAKLLVYIKPMSPKKWNEIAPLLFRAVEDEEIKVDEAGQTIDLLASYFVATSVPLPLCGDTYLSDGPWIWKRRDGDKLIIKLSSFLAFLRRVYRMNVKEMIIVRRLKEIGVYQASPNYFIGKKKSSMSVYVVPDDHNLFALAKNAPEDAKFED